MGSPHFGKTSNGLAIDCRFPLFDVGTLMLETLWPGLQMRFSYPGPGTGFLCWTGRVNNPVALTAASLFFQYTVRGANWSRFQIPNCNILQPQTCLIYYNYKTQPSQTLKSNSPFATKPDRFASNQLWHNSMYFLVFGSRFLAIARSNVHEKSLFVNTLFVKVIPRPFCERAVWRWCWSMLNPLRFFSSCLSDDCAPTGLEDVGSGRGGERRLGRWLWQRRAASLWVGHHPLAAPRAIADWRDPQKLDGRGLGEDRRNGVLLLGAIGRMFCRWRMFSSLQFLAARLQKSTWRQALDFSCSSDVAVCCAGSAGCWSTFALGTWLEVTQLQVISSRCVWILRWK